MRRVVLLGSSRSSLIWISNKASSNQVINITRRIIVVIGIIIVSGARAFLVHVRASRGRLLSAETRLVRKRSLRRKTRTFLLQVQDGPIKHVVILKSLAIKELLKKSFEVCVVRSVFESQGSTVLKIGAELCWVSLAQLFGAGAHLSVHDAFVLLFFGVSLESLPRERASNKVHEYVTETLEIIAACLFNPNVSVNGCVPRRSCQIFVLAVWNVLVAI
jgi:hypothetical protein